MDQNNFFENLLSFLGTEYGDGNLGTKGMALFFHSHICNRICKSLGLTQFDLSEREKESLDSNPGSRTVR